MYITLFATWRKKKFPNITKLKGHEPQRLMNFKIFQYDFNMISYDFSSSCQAKICNESMLHWGFVPLQNGPQSHRNRVWNHQGTQLGWNVNDSRPQLWMLSSDSSSKDLSRVGDETKKHLRISWDREYPHVSLGFHSVEQVYARWFSSNSMTSTCERTWSRLFLDHFHLS